MNICVQVFVVPCVFSSSGYMGWRISAGLYGKNVFSVYETAELSSQCLHPFALRSAMTKSSVVPHLPSIAGAVRRGGQPCGLWAILTGVVVSHCSHNLRAFDAIMMWITAFLMAVFHWIDKNLGVDKVSVTQVPWIVGDLIACPWWCPQCPMTSIFGHFSFSSPVMNFFGHCYI